MSDLTIKNSKETLVSLFSGCGGLDWGFEKQGFEIIKAFDFDEHAVNTYNKNFHKKNGCVIDVTSPEFTEELEQIKQASIVVGGFPCQGFSKAGPKNESDPRNILYKAMVKAVKKLNPEFFVAENVDGLKQNFNGQYVSQIEKDFKKLGYTVEHQILDAAGFGVPQHRRRIFFIGYKKNYNWVWPKYTHVVQTRNGEKNYNLPLLNYHNTILSTRTIKDAIGDITELTSTIPNHEVKKWSSDSQKIIQHIGEGQKLCNVRFSETSIYTWQIPEVYGEVSQDEVNILECIAKNRRKKEFGDKPNGNPLAVEVIQNLLQKKNIKKALAALVDKGYLQEKDGKYDLKGATFCSGFYKRPNWNKPSPTVLTNFDNPRYFVHPICDRPFSVRECARLQSFDDSFIFAGPIKEQYRQIGNAVPPLLSHAIATAIRNSLTFENKKGITHGLQGLETAM